MKHLFTSLLCAVAVGSPFAAAARGQDAKPDAEGYIRDWLMFAPIPLGVENAGADFIGRDQVENEAALKPKAGDKIRVQNRELTWKAVHAKEAHFDINELLGSQEENVAGYMVTYIVCDKDRPDLSLLIGSNDQGRLYLNGKEVFKFTEPRALEKDSDKVDKVTLNKGVNTIVFKVINENNNWQGSVRFTDKNGKPVTDYTVKLAP
jgi:hypothetical protein